MANEIAERIRQMILEILRQEGLQDDSDEDSNEVI